MTQRRLLLHVPEWWRDQNDGLRDGCDSFYSCYWYYLCLVYGLVGSVALIQLIRIQIRVPDFGWTTQKVFHTLNVSVCFLRSLTFGLYSFMDDLEDAISSHFFQFFIFDIPGLLFFTTYSMLVLFWAEIYHQANDDETWKLRPYYYIINLAVYTTQGLLLLYTIPDSSRNTVRYVTAAWLMILFLATAIGFMVYGSYLFKTLIDFPVNARGRKRKLKEVVSVSIVCSIAFLIRYSWFLLPLESGVDRAAFMFLFLLDKHDFDVDLMHDDLLNIVFYSLCELAPTIMILIILRKLPPHMGRRGSGSYSPLEGRSSFTG